MDPLKDLPMAQWLTIGAAVNGSVNGVAAIGSTIGAAVNGSANGAAAGAELRLG